MITSIPECTHLVPEDFHESSRVWIYQSNRLLTMSEALHLEERLQGFIDSWKSHGTPVKGFGTLFFGQFLILMADETASGVSGCSTDSSVRFVKEIETLFGIHLFDRQLRNEGSLKVKHLGWSSRPLKKNGIFFLLHVPAFSSLRCRPAYFNGRRRPGHQ